MRGQHGLRATLSQNKNKNPLIYPLKKKVPLSIANEQTNWKKTVSSNRISGKYTAQVFPQEKKRRKLRRGASTRDQKMFRDVQPPPTNAKKL